MDKKAEQERIIRQALTLPAEQRNAFVDTIADPDIKQQVNLVLGTLQSNTSRLNADSRLKHIKQPGNDSALLQAGDRVKRIHIKQLIGQGGMGAVYLGFDEKLERQVAIKSILPEHIQNPSTHQRFIREARILSKINHPSICHIYDYIETSAGDYLVLEYIEGKELFQVQLTDEEKLDVLLDLSYALAAAHKHGIVHRDLKPDNIMMTIEGQVKVLDFGIARSIESNATTLSAQSKALSSEGGQSDSLTQHGTVIGTVKYMSPEQARGEQLTTASDMFSLGIIAQELFTGQSAYELSYGDHANQELLDTVAQADRVKPVGIDSQIKALINQLTQWQANKRPDAMTTAEHIEQIRQAPLIKKSKRKRLLWVITLGILSALLIWQWMQSLVQKERTQLVNSYTESINQLVRNSEQIYVLPIHDVSGEINQLLEQAALLFGEISTHKVLTQEDKWALQGLIYLEAEEYRLAVDLLEKSNADNGLLARAWMGLYIDEMTEYSINYSIEKAFESEEIKQKYLQPALKYIAQSEQVDPVQEAFKVSQTESMDYALTLLDEVIAKQQWNKKAIKLRAQILLALAIQSLEAGNWQRAKDYYSQTAETYTTAIEMARSFPDTYLSLCEVSGVLMVDGVQRTGQQIDDYADDAINACENYLRTIPGDMYAMNALARIHMMRAQWQIETGASASESIQFAQQWAQQSLAIEVNASNLRTQALIELTEAGQKINVGQSAVDGIKQSIKTFNLALSKATTNSAYITGDLLYAYGALIPQQARAGIEYRATIEKAKFLFQKKMKQQELTHSEKKPLLVNMGAVYYVELLLLYQDGEDILDQGLAVVEYFEETAQTLKNEPNALINLAAIHLLLLDYQLDNGLSIERQLAQAEENIVKAALINPNNRWILLMQAKIAALKSLNDETQYAAVDKLFEHIVDVNSHSAESYYVWAQSYFYRLQQELDPELQKQWLALSWQKNSQALKIDAQDPAALNLNNRLLKWQKSIN